MKRGMAPLLEIGQHAASPLAGRSAFEHPGDSVSETLETADSLADLLADVRSAGTRLTGKHAGTEDRDAQRGGERYNQCDDRATPRCKRRNGGAHCHALTSGNRINRPITSAPIVIRYVCVNLLEVN